MNRIITLYLLFFFVSASLSGSDHGEKPTMQESDFSGLEKNRFGYARISPQQLALALETKNFTLINVHIPYEGEIPKTDLHIPYDQITKYADRLPAKDKALVLYCQGGGMSTEASMELARLGYTSIVELKGGFNAWKRAGYELMFK